MTPPILIETLHDGILLAVFNHRSVTNPMSRELEQAIVRTCARVNRDPKVDAVVFSGGVGRCFCAGGDFNEVSKLDGAGAEKWIERTLGLYTACLRVEKPTVAAVDKHAVGLGFQLALCFDRVVGTPRSCFRMPELKGGVGCTVGGYLLEKCLDRQRMAELVFGCSPVSAARALEWGILAQTAKPSALLAAAVRLARTLADYPSLPYRKTKAAVNRSLIDGLKGIEKVSKQAHRAIFEARTGQQHFKEILKRSGQRQHQYV